MKDRELKKLFYENCKGYTYVPSIFEDEIWDYLMSTTGEYIGTTPIWEKFCYVANEVYKGDLTKMKDEIFMVSNDLTEFFKKCLEDNFTTEKFPSNEPYMRFITIPNGRYLTFDVRDAVPQTLLYYNIMSESAFNDIYSKYEHGEILKKCKWITHKAFFRSIVPHREKYGHNFPKQLIIDTINSDDPIFSQFKNDEDDYFICGDRLYVPIYEKDIEKYQDILYKDYTATNGSKYFVDICEKKNIRRGKISVITNVSVKSTNVFYSEEYNNSLNYDYYPQVYKKITKQPLEKYDLVFGDDNIYNFFTETIW